MSLRDIVTQLRRKADAWEADAARVRDLLPHAPDGPAALERAARELRAMAHAVEHGPRELSPVDWKRLHRVSATVQTIREWCAAGQLPGARRDAAGRWRIPVDAQRLTKAAPTSARVLARPRVTGHGVALAERCADAAAAPLAGAAA